MPAMTAQGLAAFVDKVNTQCDGWLGDPRLADQLPIQLQYRTQVNDRLDPFSDEYLQQQLALYKEVSGRTLDQATGELHKENIEALLNAPNPLGLNDPARAAELVRTLTTLMAIAGLPSGARVLDMGAGHGLSSEVFAFCGCTVDAVDIDPLLAELSRKRSVSRALPITRHALNFENLSTIEDSSRDAAFFFQSLHHAIRPWDVIAEVKRKLKPGGVIGFAGEPIQQHWWRHWGLRLDQESLFVARNFGWFESGWSEEFLTACFARCGMNLQLFTGGQDGSWIGVASAQPLDAHLARARRIGHHPEDAAPLRYSTEIGHPAIVSGQRGFELAAGHTGGFLLYGPYVALPEGKHELNFELQGDEANEYRLDVVGDQGTTVFAPPELVKPGSVSRQFVTGPRSKALEFRLHVIGSGACRVTWPTVRELEPMRMGLGQTMKDLWKKAVAGVTR